VASGLLQRFATAVVLAAIVLAVLLWLPPVAAVVVVALAFAAGAWEWAGFVGLARPAARVAYVAAVAAATVAAWGWTSGPVPLAGFLRAAALWWVAAFGWVLLAPRRGGRVAAATAGFAVLVPAAIGLARLVLVEPNGRALLLYLIVLIAAADIGAYFGGRAFGRHKLAPRVSPGKTWEGLVAGMAAAAAVAALAAAPFGQRIAAWTVTCLLVALVSVVGDLVESMFKRRVGMKDSGGLLPGHGGVLDRIDSLTAAGPAFLLGLQLLGVAP
jgi:phosphatidate cytidylyltransferase